MGKLFLTYYGCIVCSYKSQIKLANICCSE